MARVSTSAEGLASRLEVIRLSPVTSTDDKKLLTAYEA
jgi:hypothetical protein